MTGTAMRDVDALRIDRSPRSEPGGRRWIAALIATLAVAALAAWSVISLR